MLSSINTRAFPVVFISTLVLFSIFVAPGYESFTSDQALFLPPVFHKLDPALFSEDLTLWDSIFTEQTLLTNILAFPSTYGIDIFWTLFLLSVLSRILFFASLYFVVRFLTGNTLYALFSLLFFVTPFWIPGTGHTTIESAFSYRALALPLGLSALALFFHGYRFLTLVPLMLGFIIHPITTAPFLLFYYIASAWRIWMSKKQQRSIKPYILPLIALTFAVVIFTIWTNGGSAGSFFLTMDEDWISLAHPRNSPAFYAFWDIQAYISLALWILLFASVIFLRKNSPPPHEYFISVALFLTPIILLLIAAIGEYTMVYGIIRPNFQRGILFIPIFSVILTSAYTFWHAEQYPKCTFTNTLLFAMLLWFLYKENFVFLREIMLLFIPPLIILLVWDATPFLRRWPRGAVFAAYAVTFLGAGFATAKAYVYSDFSSLVIFYLLLIGGSIIALFYRNDFITSSSLMKYSMFTAAPFFLALSLFSMKNFSIYPHFFYNTAYMNACAWVQKHTPKDSIFIVEPFVRTEPHEFRLACFRPIFTTFKEGGIVPYSPIREDAFDWKHRYDLIYAIRGNWDTIKTIKQEYRVDYIFSEEQLPLPDSLVYSNEKYYIYDIR